MNTWEFFKLGIKQGFKKGMTLEERIAHFACLPFWLLESEEKRPTLVKRDDKNK